MHSQIEKIFFWGLRSPPKYPIFHGFHDNFNKFFLIRAYVENNVKSLECLDKKKKKCRFFSRSQFFKFKDKISSRQMKIACSVIEFFIVYLYLISLKQN